ncbi:MAG TPA: P-II family nitrogen regulator [Nitrososphaera sp.]|nr:P-II family nitrogen regulator [Nitrososphaera sp.]
MKLIQIILAKNEVMQISEALKKIPVGGITVSKKRGRGKYPPPEIHASKGTELFRPQFGDKYVVEIVVPDHQENKVIEYVRQNASEGKIFVSPIIRVIDIKSNREGEEVI